MPVRLARRHGERRRHEDGVAAAPRQRHVELGEAHVVARRQSEREAQLVARVDDDGLRFPGRRALALEQCRAARYVNIK